MLIHSTDPSHSAHPIVNAVLREYGFEPGEIDLSIDGRDEMFRHNLYDRQGSRELALGVYFHSGFVAYRTLRRILTGCFGPRFGDDWGERIRLLDFASGYGRLTRFLLRDLPAERVTITEIDPEAVAFQEARFGVRGVVSTPEPENLPLDASKAEDRFDAIFVGSLFSHLPRRTFEGWLRRLYGLLAPGGVLIFSVHDEAAMLPGRTMPEDGLYFESQSESDFLDLEAYGSTWVTESFVADLLAQLSGGRAAYHRIPFGLWHLQDVYTVGEGVDLSQIQAGRGVQGYLDVVPVGRSAAVKLRGWAVDHDARCNARRVVIRVQGQEGGEVVHRLRPELPRPDVQAFLGGDAAYLRCGWELVLDPPPHPDAPLLVTALGSGEGAESTVLHAGSLESSLLVTLREQDRRTLNRVRDVAEKRRLALGTLRAEYKGLLSRTLDLEERFAKRGYRNSVLEIRISAMRASVFWRVRNAWFRLKKLFGVGEGPDGPP